MRRFPPILLALSMVMSALYSLAVLQGPPGIRTLCRVQSARRALGEEMARRGVPFDEHLPFLGVEWSEITTTQGDLESKTLSARSVWALRALRWFERAGLHPGDRVLVFSSSSFPALLVSVLLAAQEAGLDVTCVVSLGASSYGANRPEAPWPVMEGCLLRSRVLQRPALAYTLGGEGETGGGIPPKGLETLIRSARSAGVPIWRDRILERKLQLVRSAGPKLVVSIGGSAANLGDDPAVLEVPSGLVMPRPDAGNGLVGEVLRMGTPVLYLIDLKGLHRREGLGAGRSWVPALGLALFLAVLGVNRRFVLLEGHEGGQAMAGSAPPPGGDGAEVRIEARAR
ncbi:hypothetical protein TheveDRAFT_1787 [Thermanaerovibrio velox DSM 12556]|uniref:Poly-gamma-glutamate system protein n=1 Tax=Thermanaerovibrio velox DSM 12556 TaxID=926567 RepID=H0UR68_9BACT|nr:poly-gamma-glutamate system protein [Thermanaerovibrio velox]EHM10905.1 hypothetical protein TheveDRAFT_1787 [Thermanaerovibrio velox DSM 12556]